MMNGYGLMSSVGQERIERVIDGRALVILKRGDCSMTDVVINLLRELGANPSVYDIDKDPYSDHMRCALVSMFGKDKQRKPTPAIFAGGKFIGGVEDVIACHINGSLLPLLRQVGALWL